MLVNAPTLAAVAVADHCGILAGLQQVFAQRKPTLLFLLSGAFLLRLAQRRLLRLLFPSNPLGLPPSRTWRAVPTESVHSARSTLFTASPTLLLLRLPATQQPPDFIQQPRGMFILARLHQVQVAAQPHG